MTAAASRLRRFAACLLVVGAFAAARAEEPTSSSAHAIASENSAARGLEEAIRSEMVRNCKGSRRGWRGRQARLCEAKEKLRAISAAIAAAKPDVWKNKSQTDAVAAYVLSGGQPSEIARLLESGEVPNSEDNLLRGALAYASGSAREAKALLGDIDPRGQPPTRSAGRLRAIGVGDRKRPTKPSSCWIWPGCSRRAASSRRPRCVARSS